MFTITTQRAEDGPAIEDLLDTAFGPFRESKVSYRYRAGVAPVASLQLVARDAGDAVVGTIRYWPVLIGHAGKPGLLLGPLAVAGHARSLGIGAALVRRTLDMAAWARHERVLLVGDLAYYQRFGFVPATPHGIVMPGENPARLQALALTPNGLAGLAGPVEPWRWVRGRGGELTARTPLPNGEREGPTPEAWEGEGALYVRHRSKRAIARALTRALRAHPLPVGARVSSPAPIS
jgi:predicted N-acetyltransferase YhbS